jgi:preprotein translocase subunit Sec61beta
VATKSKRRKTAGNLIRIAVGLVGWAALGLYTVLAAPRLAATLPPRWVLIPGLILLTAAEVSRAWYRYTTLDPVRTMEFGLLLAFGPVLAGWTIVLGGGAAEALRALRSREKPLETLARGALGAGKAALWCAVAGLLWFWLFGAARFVSLEPRLILAAALAVLVRLGLDAALRALGEVDYLPDWSERLSSDAWGVFAALFGAVTVGWSTLGAQAWLGLIFVAGTRSAVRH